MVRSFTAAACLAIIGAFICALPAQAAYPGGNGRIAYTHFGCCGSDIYTVSPGGGDDTQLTSFSDAHDPVYSPDGTTIAFARNSGIWAMDDTGANQHQVLSWPLGVDRVSWSPDSASLAATLMTCTDDECRFDLYRLNADGTNVTDIKPDPFEERDPAWSPDGTKIAFDTVNSGAYQIHTIAPDGTNDITLTANGTWPTWAPYGTAIIFQRQVANRTELFGMESDGTGQVQLTDSPDSQASQPAWSPDGVQVTFTSGLTPIAVYRAVVEDGVKIPVTNGSDFEPDWQPVGEAPPPPSAYVRPKGATPMRISLVPAYQPCSAADRTHGPPLAFPSCSSFQRRSSVYTVGTPDANGIPAQSEAYVLFNVIVGNPATPADEADVRVRLHVTGVYLDEAPPVSTGAGASLQLGLRITDKLSSTSPEATVQDLTLSIPTACEDPGSSPTGMWCDIDTTLDAVSPGVARERSRAIWEVSRVELIDWGPDGEVTTEPNGVFLTSGLFVP